MQSRVCFARQAVEQVACSRSAVRFAPRDLDIPPVRLTAFEQPNLGTRVGSMTDSVRDSRPPDCRTPSSSVRSRQVREIRRACQGSRHVVRLPEELGQGRRLSGGSGHSDRVSQELGHAVRYAQGWGRDDPRRGPRGPGFRRRRRMPAARLRHKRLCTAPRKPAPGQRRSAPPSVRRKRTFTARPRAPVAGPPYELHSVGYGVTALVPGLRNRP
jgi:hypothetical protein